MEKIERNRKTDKEIPVEASGCIWMWMCISVASTPGVSGRMPAADRPTLPRRMHPGNPNASLLRFGMAKSPVQGRWSFRRKRAAVEVISILDGFGSLTGGIEPAIPQSAGSFAT